MELKEAVIVAYGRSPIARGGKNGGLRGVHPVDYAAEVLKGVLARVPQLDPAELEDVVVGCAMPEGCQGLNLARNIVLRAELPDTVPGQTVNRYCSSGLQAISTAANMIMTGQAQVMAAGGVESMSAIPMGGNIKAPNDWLVANKRSVYFPMGITAEIVADRFQVSKEQMDALAVESHKRAAAAQAAGKFDREIIPVTGVDAEGNPKTLDKDEGIRPGTSMEGLAGLKTPFKEDGKVTAGTSSQVSDGAGFVILMSREKAQALGVTPIARFVGYAVAGVDPAVMGIGPMKAVPKVMALTGLSVDDMDVVELNEAFAAQAIPCMEKLGLDPAKTNPNGGAMALGHPLGATGALLTCKILSELERRDGRYGLITMCIGGGMGAAGIVERLK